MKKLLMVFILLAGIISTAAAEPMGHFHRSPHHHGHHHHNHHHEHIADDEQKGH